jgi:hypothetical protein
MGGIMAVLEYTDIKSDDSWYPWNKRTPKPNFYYQDSLQKGPGIYTNDTFKGQAIQ